METHESRKEKAKPLKPLRCAICGDEGHSPVECRKVLNYDHSYPANHPSASNFLWWLEHGANGFSQYNPTPLNHTEINWAKIVRPSMPQNQEKTEVSFWPGRRNEYALNLPYS